MKTIDYLSNDLKEEILEAMASGECSTVNELREQFAMTRYQALQVLNDTQFMVCVAQQSKAEAKIFLHSKGFRKLKSIAESSNDKAAMSAIKMLAEFTGDMNKKSNVDINISLENQIRQEETKNVSPPLDVEFQRLEPKQVPTALNARPEETFDINEISNHLNSSFEDFEFVN